VAPDDREQRPPDDNYYKQRTTWLRQGDLFTEIPLGYPFPPDAVDHSEGNRRFLSGPFEPGFGMLLTPSCSMAAQGKPGEYAHPARILAPVIALAELVGAGAIKPGALDDLRTYDHLANYFYLPPIPAAEMAESLALLYMPITLHHDYLEERRIAQLSVEAAVHLKRQLTYHFGGELFSHDDFTD
jgi:hypothetical protein